MPGSLRILAVVALLTPLWGVPAAQTALAELDARVDAAMTRAVGDPDAELAEAEVDALRAEVQRALTAALGVPEGTLDAAFEAWLTDSALRLQLLTDAYTLSTPATAQQSADAWEALLGPDHLYLAAKLDALGLVLSETDAFEAAERALRRSLAIQEAHLAADAPGPALTRQALGALLVRRGRYRDARPVLTQALADLEATAGPGSVPYAEALAGLAQTEAVTGDPERALGQLERALAILDAPEPSPVHALTVSLRHANAYLVARTAATARATDAAAWIEEIAQAPDAARDRLLTWRDALDAAPPGDDGLVRVSLHPAAERALHRLARLLARSGDAEAAREALTVWDRIYTDALRSDAPAPTLASALASWTAALRVAAGATDVLVDDASGASVTIRSPRAEARYRFEDALATHVALFGPEHPAVAEIATDLAVELARQGSTGAAREHHQRALQVREALFGPEHPVLVGNLLGLARTSALLGDPVAAQGHAERVASSTALGAAAGVRLADALRALARSALAAQDLPLAQRLSAEVLEARTNALGPEHAAVSEALADLGDLELANGDPGAAVGFYRRALDGADAALDSTDLALARYTGALASALLQAPDGRAEAVPLLLRSARIYDRALRDRVGALSLYEQLALTQQNLAAATDAFLSAPLAGDALGEAYALFGGWKGLFVERVRQQSAALRDVRDPEYPTSEAETRRAEAYASVQRQIVRAIYGPAGPDLARLDSLSREKESLERILLSREDTDFASPVDPWTENGLSVLTSDLEIENEAFVDLYRVSASIPDSARYVAVVLNPPLDYGSDFLEEARLPGDAGALSEYRGADGISVVDLGLASEIAASVQRWRDAVLAGRPAEAETRRLQAALWDPLAEAVQPTARAVTVSPDGELARVPWAVLASDHGRASRFLVAQTTSARERLRMPPFALDAPTVLLVGGVEFGPGRPWAPLPGTALEVEQIAELADARGIETTTLAGEAPTAAAILDAAEQASHLHFATHGFVATLPQEATGGAVRGLDLEFDTGEPSGRALPRNPLAESGLALANANADMRGVLTAEDLLGIDLSGGLDGPGAQLVVLSACETGRGAEISGQGVLSLQSSVTAAGAGAVLMSLWKVPDESTAALMTAFYRALWGDEPVSPAEALARAQAEVRAQPEWRAPVHWAAWVLTGDAFPSRF